MRYKLTKKFKNFIKKNKKKLVSKNKNSFSTIKNLIYLDKSINRNQLDIVCKTLNIKQPNLKVYNFNQEKNFGLYSYFPKPKFNGVSKEFAEFIGIMLGDENIYHNVIKITIDKRDIKLREHIKYLFRKVFSLNLHEFEYKKVNAVDLRKGNKSLVELLLKYGLKRGDKIKNNLGVPDWIKNNKEYSLFCLRGLILTDGSLYYCKRDRKEYISFKNCCLKLLDDFKYLTKNTGFNFVKCGNYNIHLYRQNEVERFINITNLGNLKY